MERQWMKMDGHFAFLVNGEEIGQYHPGDEWIKAPATFNIIQSHYTFKTSYGLFVRNSLQIFNESGDPILKVKNIPFSLNANFKYQDRQFKLVFSDAPLWRWSILENDNLILSYATDLTAGISGLSIQAPNDSTEHYLFDFLLGHLVLGKEQKDIRE